MSGLTSKQSLFIALLGVAVLLGVTATLQLDLDDDGLSPVEEYRSGTSPTNADTDGDGLTDGEEKTHGTSPTQADTDNDGLTDAEELELGTDPTQADSDSDRLKDATELDIGTDPLTKDTDDDGLSDGLEYHNNARYPDANPLRTDIYIEVDEMEGTTLPRDETDKIVSQFADAPLENPDGTTGINLHFIYDDTLTAESRSTSLDLAAYYATDFNQKNRGYHYLVVVEDVYRGGNDVLGAASPGAMLVESRPEEDVTGRIAMHEIGHSLGLTKNVFDGIDSSEYYYRTYPSVMNYDSPPTSYGYSTGEASVNDFDDWGYLAKNMFTPPAAD